MKERPIIMSAPMVRAILAGTKTQTRRIAKKMVRHPDLGNLYTPGALVLEGEPHHVIERACPYGRPGDRLWVRESWAENSGTAGGYLYAADHGGASGYCRADLRTGVWTHDCSKWSPSIHMPRRASRILLEITGVRVERLQDISEADAKAEGVSMPDGTPAPPDFWSYQQEFRHLWEQINGPGSWGANPFVWVIEFRRVV